MTKPISSIELIKFRGLGYHERMLRAEAAADTARRAVRFFRQLANAYRQRREIAAVALLDDRTLKDIGLSRAELQSAARQPLWAFKPLVRRYRDSAGDQCRDELARPGARDAPSLSDTRQRLRREHYLHVRVG